MEFVYQLNLPPVKEIFLSSFAGFEDNYQLQFNYQYRQDLENIFKPEWLTFKDIKWDRVLFFRKSNFEGKIHTDIPITVMNTEAEELYTPWGVTWVWDGPGRLEYWDFTECEVNYVTAGAFNTERGKVLTYSSKNPPCKTYNLEPDKAYLVNGRIPHKATGWNERKTISYRSLDRPFTPWADVVEQFRDIII